MSGYNCICDDCKHEFQSEGIKDPNSHWKLPPNNCPECDGESITTSIIYCKPPIGFVEKEPKTLGQQAARNSKKMGRAKVEDLESKEKSEKISTKPKKPWWRSDNPANKIANLTPEQKRRYIMEGKII
jgi:hypothetical protein